MIASNKVKEKERKHSKTREKIRVVGKTMGPVRRLETQVYFPWPYFIH